MCICTMVYTLGLVLCVKVLCACMYMRYCVIVCHSSPLPSAYHLAKTEVLSQQLQTLGLQQDKVRCVYVGDRDRRETVMSCVPPSLHSYLLFFSPMLSPLLPLSPHPHTVGQGRKERG